MECHFDFDCTILAKVQTLAPSIWLDQMMIVLSSHALWLVVSALLIGLTCWRHGKSGLLFLPWVLLGFGLSDAFSSYVLKPTFQRLRPCKQFPAEVRHIDGCAGEYGFPSNHAANSAAVVTVLLGTLNLGAPGPLLIGIPLLVGISRVYLGAHYPTDVLAGFLMGSILGLLILYCRQRFKSLRKG